MKNIDIFTFPQRSDSLSTFCPFCGAHSFDGETVKTCEHLHLVYVSIAEEPLLFVSQLHKDSAYDFDSIEELLIQIDSVSPQGRYIALHEVEQGAAPYETVIVYDSMD